jgi:hypothetical protein
MGLEDLETDFICMKVNSGNGFVINTDCFF